MNIFDYVLNMKLRWVRNDRRAFLIGHEIIKKKRVRNDCPPPPRLKQHVKSNCFIIIGIMIKIVRIIKIMISEIKHTPGNNVLF